MDGKIQIETKKKHMRNITMYHKKEKDRNGKISRNKKTIKKLKLGLGEVVAMFNRMDFSLFMKAVTGHNNLYSMNSIIITRL